MSAKTKYPRGKLQFHHDVLRSFLQTMMDYRIAMGYNTSYVESIGFEPTDELMELIQRSEPQKPNGQWDGVPRCPCCGNRVRSGSTKYSPIRDNYCRVCGQHIDWSGVNAYN